jgi:hypothetical protein
MVGTPLTVAGGGVGSSLGVDVVSDGGRLAL